MSFGLVDGRWFKTFVLNRADYESNSEFIDQRHGDITAQEAQANGHEVSSESIFERANEVASGEVELTYSVPIAE